jgi:hypothetical protein
MKKQKEQEKIREKSSLIKKSGKRCNKKTMNIHMKTLSLFGQSSIKLNLQKMLI